MKKTAWKRTLGILLVASICLPNISVLAAGAAEGESAIMEEQNSVEDIRTVNESENSGFAEDKTFEIVQENVNEQTVENTDSEKGDRANSWRYKDGELLPSILRGEQYRTWPTDIPGAVGSLPECVLKLFPQNVCHNLQTAFFKQLLFTPFTVTSNMLQHI